MGGTMFARVFRLSAVAFIALQLGACINSDYDLSSILKSETPIKPGTFTKKDGTSTVVVRRFGDAYRVYNRSTKQSTFARLYKIPEYPDYLMQYYDRSKKPIVYLFLRPTEKGFDIYDIEKITAALPDHVLALLKPISQSDSNDNTINVINGKRDTLYVIREVVRYNPKVFVTESYERKP
jgi:hypothetical protein